MQHEPRCLVMQNLSLVGEDEADGAVQADGGQRLISDVEQQYPAQCPTSRRGATRWLREFRGRPPGPALRGTRDQCDRITARPPRPKCHLVVFGVLKVWQTPGDIGTRGTVRPGGAGPSQALAGPADRPSDTPRQVRLNTSWRTQLNTMLPGRRASTMPSAANRPLPAWCAGSTPRSNPILS